MAELNLKFEKWKDPCEDLIRDEDEDEDELPGDKFDRRKTRNTGPYIVGPHGYMPINDQNIPSKLHNLWICHTNFRLENYMLDIIESVNGIESLDIITPYRFRFSIATMFNEGDVKKILKDKLLTSVSSENSKIPQKVKILAGVLNAKYKFWAILQNGDDLKPIGGDTQLDVENLIVNPQADRVYRSWVDKF